MAHGADLGAARRMLAHLDRPGELQAAGFPAVFMTAWHALFQLVRLPDDATVLVVQKV